MTLGQFLADVFLARRDNPDTQCSVCGGTCWVDATQKHPNLEACGHCNGTGVEPDLALFDVK